MLPTRLLQLDGRVRDTWQPPLFLVSSNGLASGNTVTEATLHALYEVIERDSLVRARTTAPRLLDLASVDGPARALLDRLAAADADVRVEVLPSPTGTACFRALLWSEMFPVTFAGSGAHLDRDVALCRALTEAAQSRVTLIAGTRDDITPAGYRRLFSARVARPASPEAPASRTTYDEIGSVHNNGLTDDLASTVAAVADLTGRSPLLVDHTRAELGIPVVRVVCPGLSYSPG